MESWSHLVTRVEGTEKTLDFILKDQKNWKKVLERIWMLQANLIMMRWGYLSLINGRLEDNSVIAKKEEAKQIFE